MKKLIIILSILLCASIVSAAPFLVSDPEPTAIGGSYEVYDGTTLIGTATNEADGSIKMDLKDIAVGQHTVKARYFKADPIWGTVYSEYSFPFEFTRPSLAVGNIEGFRLVP